MEPPFFIIGAPRSGTTYLVEVLRRHREIVMTNETRVMTFANRIINDLGEQQFVLLNHRSEVVRAFRRAMPDVVRQIYRDLGAQEHDRWGDKFPHYADPQTDPGCLDLIDEFFPRSQFVHLIRDGRDVVASLLQKGWVDFDEACSVWMRHVTHARSFGLGIGLDRYVEVRYPDLVEHGSRTLTRILEFLELSPDTHVNRFLAEQARERTPFSGPTTDHEIGRPSWEDRLDVDQIRRAHRVLADALVEFGFEDDAWRRQLVPSVLAST